MSMRKDEPRVRFLLPPFYSRPARDHEMQVVRSFCRHVSNCGTCQLEYLRAISVLCDQGCRLEKALRSLLTWRDGDIQSSCQASGGYWSERVEIPDHEGVAKRFLKNAERQAQPRECLVQHDYDKPIKQHSALQWRIRNTYYHSTVKRYQLVTVRDTWWKTRQA